MSHILAAPWWVLLFAAIGVVALCTVIFTMFSGIGDRPDSASSTEHPPVDSVAFLRAIAGSLNAPLQRGGEARLLNNGDAFFPRLFEALAEAKESINFMVYIWEPGEVSDRLFDLLIARAREGVQVRLLIDALGGHSAPDERVEELRGSGGKWEWFHPLRFGTITLLHRRNHRRAIIVDGRVGYTGGMAVADKWLGDAQDPDHWRDSMVEVRGRLAVNLQSAFAQLWSHTTGEMLAGDAFFPDVPEDGGGRGGESISHHISVISSPSNEAQPLRRVFWYSFQSARRAIHITNPYFVPDEVMCRVLQERARAGVDVRVLVPNEHIDVALIRWASRANYDALLEAGVRIYEYQPTMIHQKLAVVDGRWSIVGSANLDVRSKELNQENVLAILDAGFAEQVEETFLADLRHAEEIRLESWRRRPLWWRVPERVSALFEEQF